MIQNAEKTDTMDSLIERVFSDTLIIIDEVHNFRQYAFEDTENAG